MIHRPATLVALLAAIFSTSCSRFDDTKTTLTILTYSTLGSKDGFLSKVQDDFKKQTGCTIFVESTLGAAQILSYLEEPKQQERIDIVMGLDEILFNRAKPFLYPISPLKIKYTKLIESHAVPGFYPTDHAALSMIYKKSEFGPGKLPLPKKLTDLLKPALRKRFIVQDPRMSSPGMWFFLFTDKIVKTSDLRKQWLAVAPSWDSSYKMFMAAEAPMVWSYLTSLAYHATKGEKDEYGFVDFEEGLPLQVEGMAVVNRPGNPYEAKPCLAKWIQYLFTPVNQTLLSQTQWMMPVMDVAVPPSFLSMVPIPSKAAVLDLSLEKVDQIITQFGRQAGD